MTAPKKRENHISYARCVNPRCRSERARLSLMKTGLVCMTCDTCHLQAFARGLDSDEGLRSLAVAEPAPLPAPSPEPMPAPAPVPVPAPEPALEPALAPEPPPPKKTGGLGWGLFR